MDEHNKAKGRCTLPISRRRFVQGLAAGGAVAALGWGGWQAFGETGQRQAPTTLTGKDFELNIDSLPVNFNGRHSVATAVNGSVPGPILKWREGDTVTVAVTNHLKVPTSIHWHAIRLPADMDGVPGLSFPGIVWGFNGQKFSSAEPIELKLGERVRFVLINDTMMEHPIHLHGLWSELENGHGDFNPYKHTIIVKPAERVSYLVSADTPGHWAYHCHLLYHMEAGMFRTVVVS